MCPKRTKEINALQERDNYKCSETNNKNNLSDEDVLHLCIAQEDISMAKWVIKQLSTVNL